eukprot:a841657_138.p1 GENE.a841657_138~~a841657_138.p1  ORF type:complete len:293 (-),score=109.42 a841657_138:157-984(-)
MAARGRCMLFKNEESAAAGVLVAVPDTVEALLSKAEQKLGISGATTLYTQAGVKVEDLDSIQNEEPIYVAVNNEAFFGGNKKGKKTSSLEDYKVAILGGGGVGKSCITMRYCRSTFVETYDPTIEDSFRKTLTFENFPVLLDILDTAGQDDFVVLRRQWIEDRDGFVLVYAINDRTTLDDAVKSFADLIREVKGADVEKVPCVLVGNKKDLADQREVSEDAARAFLKRNMHQYATFHEVSALTGENVSEIFNDVIRQFRRWNPPKAAKKGFCALL